MRGTGYFAGFLTGIRTTIALAAATATGYLIGRKLAKSIDEEPKTPEKE